MGLTCWYKDEDYHYLAGADRAGIAWEFLRRNPDYRAVAHRGPRPATTISDGIELIEGGASALRWGLLFRRRPRPARWRCATLLGTSRP
jgi:hypothetical protein